MISSAISQELVINCNIRPMLGTPYQYKLYETRKLDKWEEITEERNQTVNPTEESSFSFLMFTHFYSKYLCYVMMPDKFIIVVIEHSES